MIYVAGLGEPICDAFIKSGESKEDFSRRIGCSPDALQEILLGGDGHGVGAALGTSLDEFNLNLSVVLNEEGDFSKPRVYQPVFELKRQAFRVIVAQKMTSDLDICINVLGQVEREFYLATRESRQIHLKFRGQQKSLQITADSVKEMVDKAHKQKNTQPGLFD